ncbi:nicotinate-nucleotide adenylyltransferase [Sporolactobacillus pectinivorans]|uniref:nicotinate-nucleotide adenylyltransferase n=1 Tax=Sporolactobacillus pectinivorans TaxID=1591408 RepID=UPI000C25C306|nr:nicotinate-nucleotide adenylyltransferase [Sporolactobacillus pectinivorans]
MKKIGLLGGTFDPPHLMHLLIAQEALETCKLDEVWFLPSYIPPHIQGKIAHTGADDRQEMVSRAIMGNERFRLSTVEVRRKGKSYTVDTLRELKSQYPDNRFYFILGADMVDDLPTWHGIDELRRLTSFIGFRRPGFPAGNPARVDVIYIDMPLIDISSSILRRRLRDGRSCRYFLADAVIKYIRERQLYED